MGISAQRRHRSVAVLILACLAVGACSPATVAPGSSAPAPTGSASSASSSDSASADASALASAPPSSDASDVAPTQPPPVTGFVTPVPPAAGAAWTGIAWRQLDPADPLGPVRSVTRWRGGFVALGAPTPSGVTARTPVWVSADGATWRPLDASVFGPKTLVIGVEATPGGVAAITVQGGPNDCGDETEPLFCWTPTLPLQSWTSSDGSAWTAHPGPAIQLTPDCDDCGIDLPLVAAGKPGILVVGRPTSGLQLALSTDGITWEVLPASAFPDAFFPNDVAGFGSGFVAVGQTTDDPGRAVAFFSSDGRTWQSHPLAAAAVDAQTDTSADSLAVGPAGAVAKGGTGAAPGLSLWWSTLDGGAWSELAKYPPLGVWTGDGEGSGLMEDGNLVGDGERIIAYRGGAKAAGWASADGRSWQPLQLTGTGPATSENDPTIDLTLLPIGVVWLADDGTIWFGQPSG